jgi:hypothetical protein
MNILVKTEKMENQTVYNIQDSNVNNNKNSHNDGK